MRLSPTEIEKISRSVLKQLSSAGAAVGDEVKATNIIINVINESIEAEQQLEEDALKLLKQHKKAMGDAIDENKAIRMIKQKLAAERKFVL
jgi:hypothetical protein